MTQLTPAAVEFMRLSGMSDDPNQDLSQLPIMEWLALVSINFATQQSDTLNAQQQILRSTADEIQKQNLASLNTELRAKIVSGNYSWPTDAAACQTLAGLLDTDAALPPLALPPGPPDTSSNSVNQYQQAITSAQGILTNLTLAPTDDKSTGTPWPTDTTLTAALVNWCEKQGLTFPTVSIPAYPGVGPTKLNVPIAINEDIDRTYVDSAGVPHELIMSSKTDDYTVARSTINDGVHWGADEFHLYPPGQDNVRGPFMTYYDPYAQTFHVEFVPNASVVNLWGSPNFKVVPPGMTQALPVTQINGKNYIWTTSSPPELNDGSMQSFAAIAAWQQGQPWQPYINNGQLKRWEPPPPATTLQQWADSYSDKAAEMQTNARNWTNSAQSQNVSLQMASTNYANGWSYASGTLGKRDDMFTGIEHNIT